MNVAEASFETSYREAASLLQSARTLAASGRFPEAAAQLQLGLEVLGNDYADNDVLDDTSTKYALAKSHLRNGRAQRAVPILERVLETRLSLYAHKHRIAH